MKKLTKKQQTHVKAGGSKLNWNACLTPGDFLVVKDNRGLRVETLSCPGPIRILRDPANFALAPYSFGAFGFENLTSKED